MRARLTHTHARHLISTQQKLGSGPAEVSKQVQVSHTHKRACFCVHVQSHEPLIKVGLSGLELLLSHCAAAGDLRSLRQLLGRLEPALHAQLAHVMHATQHLQQAQLAQHLQRHLLARAGSSSAAAAFAGGQQGGAQQQQQQAAVARAALFGPLVVSGGGPQQAGGGAWPAPLAAASHMLLLAHRMLARVHAAHRRALPWRLQALLLRPLLHCARQCAVFNQRLEQEATCAQLVVAAGTGDGPGAAAATSLLAQVLSGADVTAGPSSTSGAANNAKTAGEGGAEGGASVHGAAFPPISPFQRLSHLASFTAPNVTAEVAAAAAAAVAGAGTAAAAAAAAAAPRRQSTDQDEVVADSILEAGTAAQAQAQLAAGANAARVAAARAAAEQPVTPTAAVAAEPGHASRSPPGAVRASASPRQGAVGGVVAATPLTLLPGAAHVSLVRLEMETARCVMDAAEACCAAQQQGGGGKQAVEEEADEDGQEQRPALAPELSGPSALLRALCGDVIRHSAAALTQALQLRVGDDSLCLLSSPGPSDRLGGAGGSQPLQSASGVVASGAVAGPGGWLEELRAPLVAHAVLVAGGMPGGGEAAHVRGLFPHLVVVMCSYQAMVREAVAVYFSQVVRPMVMGGGGGSSALL